ncbi:MAG: IS3 family transposase, partial [Planctomycetaceae bacterium]|nr:IS3 family transposase [Planctomycetaceae bacterium]
MCQVLGVSRSGYYAWRNRPVSDRQQQQHELVEQMPSIHQEKPNDCYGSPRMHKELVARGYDVCENTVAQLMKGHELKGSTKKKFRQTTDSNHPHPVAANLLNQAFERDKPDQVRVSKL